MQKCLRTITARNFRARVESLLLKCYFFGVFACACALYIGVLSTKVIALCRWAIEGIQVLYSILWIIIHD